MGNAATEFPGDQALLPQSSHVPPQGSLHLPGAGEETQLSPCFQRCKNKKADGPAPSAHPPPRQPWSLCHPTQPCQELRSQGSWGAGVAEHESCDTRKGARGYRVLYPLPLSLHVTSPFSSSSFLAQFLHSSFLSFFPFVFLSAPSLPRSSQNGPYAKSQAA